MRSSPIAVIDIGSNSIKILVAERTNQLLVRSLGTKTIDARISAGISQATPRLTDESMLRGIDAIRALLAFAAPFSPQQTIAVATSAVRDAQNGADFRALVRAKTGLELRILSGDEEANLVGRGLLCDPALATLRDFYVFDLGGGSLECLSFRGRRIAQAASLKLGCVRLTETVVVDASRPLPAGTATDIEDRVGRALVGNYDFSLPAGTVAVGTGGTITTVRAIIAARAGCALELTDADVAVDQLLLLAAELGALSLADRQRIAGLPATRADVFPVALLTLVALAGLGGFPSYRHSFYNLRFGLAAEALGVA